MKADARDSGMDVTKRMNELRQLYRLARSLARARAPDGTRMAGARLCLQRSMAAYVKAADRRLPGARELLEKARWALRDHHEEAARLLVEAGRGTISMPEAVRRCGAASPGALGDVARDLLRALG